MMVHTGTSALWTTTRSLPDSAVCVRQLGNSRQRRCCFLFTIRSASATGISTGSGVHKPALTREESSTGPRPLDSQFSNTLPEGSVFWRESADGAKQEINRTCVGEDLDLLRPGLDVLVNVHVHCGLQLCARRVQGGAGVVIFFNAHILAACEALPELHASEHVVAATQRADVAVAPQVNVKYLGDEVDAAEAVAAQADARQLQACERANRSTTGNQGKH
jgi:hypothetical protein